ncbi:phosphatidate cytidylyltransferase [Peribacillus deserti]|uniref:Phosphatidate cytidylyltransferase n=1 Tax=Peribacillus deserti TaxID=673318 RepID=A0ABS2QPI7_9BACI|nr:phosphatidate cytidylyltransferase [Peribacillus deserti]MBM7694855.1 phosphatidate cytidylyltransferase [Peribacillus deserti]
MRQRIITGIIAAAVFLPLVIMGGVPLLATAYLLGTVGLYELFKMRKMPLLSMPSVLSYAALWIVLMPAAAFDNLTNEMYTKLEIVLLLVLLLLTFTVLSKNKYTYDDAGFMIISVLYVGMGFYYFYETREIDNGLTYIFFTLFIIWATDSGAYFVGRAMGKRKLWPDISPNKTIEGAVGGIICGLLVAVVFFLFTNISDPLWKLAAISIFISIFGQIGDLVQSAYKRLYGIKDSGNILPGHGGILDRLDSLIFVLPILHLLHFL